MGPSALRVANLNRRLAALGYKVADLGNVPVEQAESLQRGRPARPLRAADRRHLQAPGRDGGAGARRGSSRRWCSAATTRWPSAPSPACPRFFRKRKKQIGLIWMDAHADMNTPETSPSGNVHGMPLACVVGHGAAGAHATCSASLPRWTPRNVAHGRPARRGRDWRSPTCSESGVRAFTMRDIDERGMRAVMQEAMRIATDGHRRLSPLARHGFRRSAGRARRRHARARRRHLPRGASGHGNDLRFRGAWSPWKWWR